MARQNFFFWLAPKNITEPEDILTFPT